MNSPSKTIKRLYSYMKEDNKKIIMIIIMIIMATIFSIVSPLIMKYIIDQLIGKQKNYLLIYTLIFLFIIYLINALFNWLSNLMMVKVSENSLYKSRKHLFNHINSLALSFYEKNKKGDIMSRFTNDFTIISDTFSDAIISLISSLIILIGVTIIMFILNPLLACINILMLPILGFGVMFIGKKAGFYYDKQQASLGNLNSYIEESISGIKIVKSFAKEKDTVSKFNIKSDELKDTAIKANLYANMVMPVNMFVNNIGNILIIIIGAIMTLRGHETIGGILAFLTYSNMFRQPIVQIASLFTSIQGALAGANRIFEFLDEDIRIKEIDKPIILNDTKGNIEFSNVTFSYLKDKPVLKNVSFKANKGDLIALVGKTGAGKTTIINLLLRFYDVDSGKILLDNHNIKDLSKNSLRSHIGVVLQDTYLFKGTVMDNIKIAKIDATLEEVMEASKKARAHGFIHRLPDGYHTLVLEEGSNFSQGERQLIAIARAILANHSILILDEATSSIDTNTERQIQEGIEELMKDKTTFVIAHRLSTISSADIILVLENGQIVESGSHQGLLDKKGNYYQLYESQFK